MKPVDIKDVVVHTRVLGDWSQFRQYVITYEDNKQYLAGFFSFRGNDPICIMMYKSIGNLHDVKNNVIVKIEEIETDEELEAILATYGPARIASKFKIRKTDSDQFVYIHTLDYEDDDYVLLDLKEVAMLYAPSFDNRMGHGGWFVSFSASIKTGSNLKSVTFTRKIEGDEYIFTNEHVMVYGNDGVTPLAVEREREMFKELEEQWMKVKATQQS